MAYPNQGQTVAATKPAGKRPMGKTKIPTVSPQMGRAALLQGLTKKGTC